MESELIATLCIYVRTCGVHENCVMTCILMCHMYIRIRCKSGKIMCQGGGKPDTGKFRSSYIGMNVCGSTYENGCVVNGMYATAAN